jgi:isocitrate lyase
MTHNRPGDQIQTAAELETEWKTDARWNGIDRDFSAEDVIALRGSVREDHTLARRGAENLWSLIQRDNTEWVAALGALTGNQAVQQVRAGLEAIYLSGRLRPTPTSQARLILTKASTRSTVFLR